MQLTANFTLEEMVVSRTAVVNGIDNTPPKDVIANLRRTCEILEIVRQEIKVPIIITSGYRSPDLNVAVGGSKTSAHMRGLAADFIAPGYGTPYAVCRAILDNGSIPYEQLIHEFGNWIHLGIAEGSSLDWKMEELTIANRSLQVNGELRSPYTYVKGIHKIPQIRG